MKLQTLWTLCLTVIVSGSTFTNFNIYKIVTNPNRTKTKPIVFDQISLKDDKISFEKISNKLTLSECFDPLNIKIFNIKKTLTWWCRRIYKLDIAITGTNDIYQISSRNDELIEDLFSQISGLKDKRLVESNSPQNNSIPEQSTLLSSESVTLVTSAPIITPSSVASISSTAGGSAYGSVSNILSWESNEDEKMEKDGKSPQSLLSVGSNQILSEIQDNKEDSSIQDSADEQIVTNVSVDTSSPPSFSQAITDTNGTNPMISSTIVTITSSPSILLPSPPFPMDNMEKVDYSNMNEFIEYVLGKPLSNQKEYQIQISKFGKDDIKTLISSNGRYSIGSESYFTFNDLSTMTFESHPSSESPRLRVNIPEDSYNSKKINPEDRVLKSLYDKRYLFIIPAFRVSDIVNSIDNRRFKKWPQYQNILAMATASVVGLSKSNNYCNFQSFGGVQFNFRNGFFLSPDPNNLEGLKRLNEWFKKDFQAQYIEGANVCAELSKEKTGQFVPIEAKDKFINLLLIPHLDISSKFDINEIEKLKEPILEYYSNCYEFIYRLMAATSDSKPVKRIILGPLTTDRVTIPISLSFEALARVHVQYAPFLKAHGITFQRPAKLVFLYKWEGSERQSNVMEEGLKILQDSDLPLKITRTKNVDPKNTREIDLLSSFLRSRRNASKSSSNKEEKVSSDQKEREQERNEKGKEMKISQKRTIEPIKILHDGVILKDHGSKEEEELSSISNKIHEDILRHSNLLSKESTIPDILSPLPFAISSSTDESLTFPEQDTTIKPLIELEKKEKEELSTFDISLPKNDNLRILDSNPIISSSIPPIDQRNDQVDQHNDLAQKIINFELVQSKKKGENESVIESELFPKELVSEYLGDYDANENEDKDKNRKESAKQSEITEIEMNGVILEPFKLDKESPLSLKNNKNENLIISPFESIIKELEKEGELKNRVQSDKTDNLPGSEKPENINLSTFATTPLEPEKGDILKGETNEKEDSDDDIASVNTRSTSMAESNNRSPQKNVILELIREISPNKERHSGEKGDDDDDEESKIIDSVQIDKKQHQDDKMEKRDQEEQEKDSKSDKEKEKEEIISTPEQSEIVELFKRDKVETFETSQEIESETLDTLVSTDGIENIATDKTEIKEKEKSITSIEENKNSRKEFRFPFDEQEVEKFFKEIEGEALGEEWDTKEELEDSNNESLPFQLSQPRRPRLSSFIHIPSSSDEEDDGNDSFEPSWKRGPNGRLSRTRENI